MKLDHSPPIEPDFVLKIKASESELWDLHDIFCSVVRTPTSDMRFSQEQRDSAKWLLSYIDTMLTTWDK